MALAADEGTARCRPLAPLSGSSPNLAPGRPCAAVSCWPAARALPRLVCAPQPLRSHVVAVPCEGRGGPPAVRRPTAARAGTPAQHSLCLGAAPSAGAAGAFRTLHAQGFCNRYLVQALPPQRTRAITMLTSNFSHSGLLHLGINMLAFSGFGGAVCQARPRGAGLPRPGPESRLSSGVRGCITRV